LFVNIFARFSQWRKGISFGNDLERVVVLETIETGNAFSTEIMIVGLMEESSCYIGDNNISLLNEFFVSIIERNEMN
jgi:hypothetical protein